MNRAKILSANWLKLIAILAMSVDHIAWAFVPTESIPGQLMHVIGRLTAPIMFYFIAEGYAHTRSVERYAGRLFVFALLSQLPYSLFLSGNVSVLFPLNVLFTLLLGLLALWAVDKAPNRAFQFIAVVVCCFAAIITEWMSFGVLFILAFGRNRGNFQKQALSFAVIAVTMSLFMMLSAWPSFEFYHFGMLLALPVLYCYNGKPGSNKGLKWAFYMYYPAHLLLLALLMLYFGSAV